MASVYISEIPNAPGIQEMPTANYPAIPSIRNKGLDMSVNMGPSIAALQQKDLPGGFKRGLDIAAEAAGKGQMAMGKAVASGTDAMAGALGKASWALQKVAERAIDDEDAMAIQHTNDNREIWKAKFDADTAEMTIQEKMDAWDKRVPELQAMNSTYGRRRVTRDRIESADNAYGLTGRYKLQIDEAQRVSKEQTDYGLSIIDKAIQEPTAENIQAAREANSTGHQRQWWNKGKFEEHEDKLRTAERKTVEVESLNKDPWRMRDQTDLLMKGEKSDDFPYLKDNPERARQLNAAAKAQINEIEQQGSETYQDRLSKGDIPFEDRDKVAKELHVRPHVAKSINKDADVPDPAYNPKVASNLDTRLQSLDPAKMDPDKLVEEIYGIKDDIRQLPRSHRAEYSDRLSDTLERARSNKPIELADKALGDIFKHLETIDTGKEGSLFGWDGTNGKTGKDMKIEDPRVFSQHYMNMLAIKDGLRLFTAKKPDATLGEIRDEYNRLAKQYIEAPSSKQAFEQAKLPAPETTAEAIAAAEKKFKERVPPTSIPVQPTTGAGYVTPAGKSQEPSKTGLGPGGYPIRQEITPETNSGAPTPYTEKLPPGTSSFGAAFGTYSEAIAGGLPPGKLVPRILGSEPLPTLDYSRLARQAMGLEPIPRAELSRLPGLEREKAAAEGTPAPMRVTAYVPGMGGQEGANEVASRSGPAYTVEDYREGKAPHVSVAMDPKSELQGKYLRSTDPEYEGVVFKVEDTGSAFKGKGSGAVDIAFRDKTKATNYGKNAEFVAIGDDEAIKIAGARHQALPYGRLERQASGVEPAPGAIAIRQAVDPTHPAMSRPRDVSQISKIVVHGDVLTDVDELVAYSKSADRGYHYYIALDGEVTQVVPDDRKAYHIQGANADSIGIILVGADNGKQPTAAQDAAAKKLISELGRKYGIDPKNVAGHGERQPNRRHAEEGGHVARDIRENGYI